MITTDNKKHTVNTILIAEDEYLNYQIILASIEKNQINTMYAANGQQAVDLCRAHSEIDLILMNIKMPIMDGCTAAKLIKGFRSDLPIIAYTAYAPEIEQEIFNGTFDDYISKPIRKEILHQKLLKYINL